MNSQFYSIIAGTSVLLIAVYVIGGFIYGHYFNKK